MIKLKCKRGRPISTPQSIERKKHLDQMPLYIKVRINDRKLFMAEAVKSVPQRADVKVYRKKIRQAESIASWSTFTEAEKSMDTWWRNFCSLGLTQDYVDSLECFERGIDLSLDEQRRFLQAKRFLDQKQKTNSRKATAAVNARWSNDKAHVDDKRIANQLMMKLSKTERGRKLNTSGRARWLAANWPNPNKPSDRTLLRYVSNKKCANTEK